MTVTWRACVDVVRSQVELQSAPRSQSAVESNPASQTHDDGDDEIAYFNVRWETRSLV